MQILVRPDLGKSRFGNYIFVLQSFSCRNMGIFTEFYITSFSDAKLNGHHIVNPKLPSWVWKRVWFRSGFIRFHNMHWWKRMGGKKFQHGHGISIYNSTNDKIPAGQRRDLAEEHDSRIYGKYNVMVGVTRRKKMLLPLWFPGAI